MKKLFSGSIGKRFLFIACLSLLLFPAMNASAYMIALDHPNTDMVPFPGPYAYVTITTLNAGTQAKIVFAGATQTGYSQYKLGGVALNVNGPFTVALGPDMTSGGLGNIGGQGWFEYTTTVNGSSGWPTASTTRTVTLTNTSGGSWKLDGSDVLALGSVGNNKDATYLAAAHIFIPNADGTAALKTGTAGGSSPVPIPGAVWLLGSGLMGLVGVRRRFRS